MHLRAGYNKRKGSAAAFESGLEAALIGELQYFLFVRWPIELFGLVWSRDFFLAREAVRQAHLITFPAAFPNASPVWRPSEDRQAESEAGECQGKDKRSD